MMAVPERLTAVVRVVPGLQLLVLHGSRARGTSHDRSDWDFAYVGEETLDPDALLATLNEAIGTDAVDLADLAEGSALLRYRVARDGIVVHEATPGTFDTFRLDAIHTWCDMEPVLTPLYDKVLEDLKR
jgi:predicted nucleotidyltransferase